MASVPVSAIGVGVASCTYERIKVCVPSVYPAVSRPPADCSERRSECVRLADPVRSSGAVRDTHVAADQAPTHSDTHTHTRV